MIAFAYDGTLDGFCCVVFEAYSRRVVPAGIEPVGRTQGGLFAERESIATDPAMAQRVVRGLRERTSAETVRHFEYALRSQEPGVELRLFRCVMGAFGAPDGSGAPTAADLVREMEEVERLARRVGREVHRMHAFVRFERREGGREHECWVAEVAPVYDVLPLLADHFAARYPGQRWEIHDVRRSTRLVHDRSGAVAEPAAAYGRAADAPSEPEMQALWHTYFHAVDIPERRNLDLQRRHVPLRYRRYMNEMRPRL